MSKRWFVVTTNAQEPFRSYVGLEAAGFSVFCPFERVTYRRGRHSRVKLLAVVPGYIFVQCESDVLGRALEVEGVREVIRAPADEVKVDRLRRLSEMGAWDNTGARWVEMGQEVVANDPAIGKLFAKIRSTPRHKRAKRLELDGDFPFRVTAPIDKLTRVKA